MALTWQIYNWDMCEDRHEINHTLTALHTQTHTLLYCRWGVSSWDPWGDTCVKTTYWFCSSVALFLYPKTTDLVSSGYYWCIFHKKHHVPSTLKSHLALQGLKAHVKLKATLGVGIKNWVASCSNQVEHSTQHLDRRMGSFKHYQFIYTKAVFETWCTTPAKQTLAGWRWSCVQYRLDVYLRGL